MLIIIIGQSLFFPMLIFYEALTCLATTVQDRLMRQGVNILIYTYMKLGIHFSSHKYSSRV